MEEEVTARTVNLAVQTTKLSARQIFHGLGKLLKYITKKMNEMPQGLQSVQELIGQNQGVSTIPISKTDLRGFTQIAQKYNVDFAIRKNSAVDPPQYTVFFKARDTDALTAAYNEYTTKVLRKEKRPSLLQQLKNLAKAIHRPNREKEKDKAKDR